VRGHSFRFRRSGAATFSASDQGTAESRVVRIEAAVVAGRDAGPDDTLEHVTENIAAAEALVAGA
jgi:predicted benzoate:H+ symporter BenE